MDDQDSSAADIPSELQRLSFSAKIAALFLLFYSPEDAFERLYSSRPPYFYYFLLLLFLILPALLNNLLLPSEHVRELFFLVNSVFPIQPDVFKALFTYWPPTALLLFGVFTIPAIKYYLDRTDTGYIDLFAGVLFSFFPALIFGVLLRIFQLLIFYHLIPHAYWLQLFLTVAFIFFVFWGFYLWLILLRGLVEVSIKTGVAASAVGFCAALIPVLLLFAVRLSLPYLSVNKSENIEEHQRIISDSLRLQEERRRGSP